MTQNFHEFTAINKNVPQLRTDIVIVFIRSVAAVISLVTETPTSNTLVVVTTKPSFGITLDGMTYRLCLIRFITAVIISITHPLRSNTNLQQASR